MNNHLIDIRQLLILTILDQQDASIEALSTTIQDCSGGIIKTAWGRLFPDMLQLEMNEWIKKQPRDSHGSMPYTITDEGRQAYAAMLKAWKDYTTALGNIHTTLTMRRQTEQTA